MKVNPTIADPIQAAYWAGVEAGIRRFAWWKDGVEECGTCGTSLSKALRDMDAEAGTKCWHPGYRDDDGVQYCVRCGVAESSEG